MTRRRIVRTVKGIAVVMDFDLASSVQKEMNDTLQAGDAYENATTAFMLRTIQPGDFVVDVGAHIGYFTLLMAALVGPLGRVLAFEPNPENYQRLLGHLAANGLQNVTPFQMAVGDQRGVVDLWINRDNDGGHAVYDVGQFPSNVKSKEHPQRIPVWMTTLDEHLRGVPKVRLIKIDTEGSEQRVMAGCDHCPDYVVSEIHRDGLSILGSNEMDYRDGMTARGYSTGIPTLDGSLEDATGKTVNGNYVFNVVFSHG